MRRMRRRRGGKPCALCGAPAVTNGQYEPSLDEKSRWGFAPIKCGLCGECERLPNLGNLLSARFGLASSQGGVQ